MAGGCGPFVTALWRRVSGFSVEERATNPGNSNLRGAQRPFGLLPAGLMTPRLIFQKLGAWRLEGFLFPA